MEHKEKKLVIVLGDFIVKHSNDYENSRHSPSNSKDYVWNFHEAKTKFTIYYMKLPVQGNLNHFVFHVRTDDRNSERSLKLIAKSIVDLVPTFKNNTMPVFRKKHLLFVSNELSEISKERNSTIRRRSNNNI